MCTKKAYDRKWQAKKALAAIIKQYSKRPWRNEMSIHECDECGKYHLTSKYSDYTPTKILEKEYYDLQKEKWGNWLQNYSKNKGNI